MTNFEILYEGKVRKSGFVKNTDASPVEGFFALRQILAESIEEAVPIGIKVILDELSEFNDNITSNIKSLEPIETREVDISDSRDIFGFTFYWSYPITVNYGGVRVTRALTPN